MHLNALTVDYVKETAHISQLIWMKLELHPLIRINALDAVYVRLNAQLKQLSFKYVTKL